MSHGIGFVSTLNPQGPVNFSDWIAGNYYNAIWKHIKNLNSFDGGLIDLFENSKLSRENIYVLKNFPKNALVIEHFIRGHEVYQKSFVFLNSDEVSMEEMSNLNYHFAVESSLLVNWTSNLDKINKFYENIVEIDLSLVSTT